MLSTNPKIAGLADNLGLQGRGFIGFFDLDERILSPDEVEALRITANLLGTALGYR